jgi:hypothetical protein
MDNLIGSSLMICLAQEELGQLSQLSDESIGILSLVGELDEDCVRLWHGYPSTLDCDTRAFWFWRG